jgi:hypothetical protein
VPIVDLPLDAGHDLVGEGLPALPADGQGEHAGYASIGLARLLYQYSYGN